MNSLPPGVGAIYTPKMLGMFDNIQVPKADEISDESLRHESAHTIYDKADLYKIADKLAGVLPEALRSKISQYPIYTRKGLSNKLLTNEGLAFAVENPEQASYTNTVANLIQNPVIKQRLLRIQQKKPRPPFEDLSSYNPLSLEQLYEVIKEWKKKRQPQE
jgi:hypothetical protein